MIRLWPRSLFGRNLLLLFSLAVVVQVSGVAIFFYMLRPRIVELGELVAAQINTLDEVLSGVSPEQRDYYIQRIERNGRLKVLDRDVQPNTSRTKSLFVALFMEAVRKNLDSDIPVRWYNRVGPQLLAAINIGGKRYWIASPIGFPLQWRALMLALLLPTVMAVAAALVAVVIQRRINRPLKDIAEAARKVGTGGRADRLPIYEASELAAVARQFNAMFDSLEEMESTRAVMLAGISHDIRTPLTKLRLGLAMDAQAGHEASYIRYIDQIDAIVGQFLDFGRIGYDEPFVEGDLNELICQLAGLFEERGHVFHLALHELPACRFRQVAMSRIITNLMDNAVKYGVHGLQVRSWCEDCLIHVAVLDGGPGWPDVHERMLLIKPFVRASGARSGVSGTGLGLAIVDRLVRLQGGSLQLRNRAEGGAEAIVTLRESLLPT